MFPHTTPPKPPAVTPVAGVQTLRQIDSESLLGPGGELFILHQQQVYRLRITAQGKLILTK